MPIGVRIFIGFIVACFLALLIILGGGLVKNVPPVEHHPGPNVSMTCLKSLTVQCR